VIRSAGISIALPTLRSGNPSPRPNEGVEVEPDARLALADCLHAFPAAPGAAGRYAHAAGASFPDGLDHDRTFREHTNRVKAETMTKLVLWKFISGGGELYALSTGRTPPAEEYVLKNWKRLETTVDATEEAINKITYESARDILGNIQRQQYHTLETKVLRTEWKRPTH
jgi:hypothetical protein